MPSFNQTLVGYGGFAVTPKVPTRWDGTRCVDWAICNRPDACENPKLLDVHLSDHIPVCFHIHGLGHALQLGSLARTCTMACPPGVDRSLWERAVSQEWNQNESVQQFLSQLATDAVVSVQSEWDLFQDLLVSCILSAYRWLSRVGLLTAEVRSNCEKLADQRPFKGQLAVHRVLSCAHAGVRHQVGFMAVRKKRRLLARCFQYKRLLLRRLSSGLSAVQSSEFESLRDHLVRHFGVDLSLRVVLRHIENIQSELRGIEEQARSHNISQWRQRMVASDADLSRWLKCRSTPVGVGVVDHEGNQCESDVGAAQAVFDFWDQFWSAARARQPPVPERVASLLSGLPRLPVQQWDPPSAQQLRLVALDGRGSHGPDGWVAREVAWLPLEIFETFSILGARWMKAGCVPAQFCESRMISIPKPGKVENHTIKVGHLRPITVLSVWWRIWTSSWCKTALRAWMRQHVPRQFAVAHCVSTGEVVVDLLDRLMAGGYLASLDYSKAYDLLDP